MLRHISEIGDVGIVVREYRAWEWFDLAEADRGPSQAMPRNGGRFNAGAHREISHGVAPGPMARMSSPISD